MNYINSFLRIIHRYSIILLIMYLIEKNIKIFLKINYYFAFKITNKKEKTIFNKNKKNNKLF